MAIKNRKDCNPCEWWARVLNNYFYVNFDWVHDCQCWGKKVHIMPLDQDNEKRVSWIKLQDNKYSYDYYDSLH